MLERYPCVMCGAESTIQIIEGAFRVATCTEHRETTWGAWRAQRAITHPPRPPRKSYE